MRRGALLVSPSLTMDARRPWTACVVLSSSLKSKAKMERSTSARS